MAALKLEMINQKLVSLVMIALDLIQMVKINSNAIVDLPVHFQIILLLNKSVPKLIQLLSENVDINLWQIKYLANQDITVLIVLNHLIGNSVQELLQPLPITALLLYLVLILSGVDCVKIETLLLMIKANVWIQELKMI